MKRHYVTRWIYDNTLFTIAACGQAVYTHGHSSYDLPGSTFRKNHVTCRNCHRTKVFRGVR